MNTELSLIVEDERWSRALDIKNMTRTIQEIADTLSQTHDIDNTMVDITLSNDKRVQELNQEWRGKDTPTNVLSFSADRAGQQGQEVIHLGDIIMAFETVRDEAQKQNKTLFNHTVHLSAHGLLHLLGYDHETESDAEKMEALEIELLKRHNISNPYND